MGPLRERRFSLISSEANARLWILGIGDVINTQVRFLGQIVFCFLLWASGTRWNVEFCWKSTKRTSLQFFGTLLDISWFSQQCRKMTYQIRWPKNPFQHHEWCEFDKFRIFVTEKKQSLTSSCHSCQRRPFDYVVELNCLRALRKSRVNFLECDGYNSA